MNKMNVLKVYKLTGLLVK